MKDTRFGSSEEEYKQIVEASKSMGLKPAAFTKYCVFKVLRELEKKVD